MHWYFSRTQAIHLQFVKFKVAVLIDLYPHDNVQVENPPQDTVNWEEQAKKVIRFCFLWWPWRLHLIVVHDVYILYIHIYLTTFLYVKDTATFLQSLVVLTVT